MSKSDKAEELIRLIEELIDVKVADAVAASSSSCFDSMTGFESYARIKKIKEDLLKTLVNNETSMGTRYGVLC